MYIPYWNNVETNEKYTWCVCGEGNDLLFMNVFFISNFSYRPSASGRGSRVSEKWVYSASHHGWSIKKVLGFRWSKKAKTTLQLLKFSQNISISIFKFSPFLHIIKAWWWNLIHFSDFRNVFIRKEKALIQQSMRIEKLEKVGLYFVTGCFIKSFKNLPFFFSIGLFVHMIYSFI